MAFGNRRRLHTKPSTSGWSVVFGLYKLMTPPISLDIQLKNYSIRSSTITVAYSVLVSFPGHTDASQQNVLARSVH